VAHNRKETEELYQKLSEIDLVLLDMSLPDVSGLDLAKQIKIIRKDIPVIAQTAMTVEDNGKQFLDAGCDGYITKPYRRDQVLTAINHFMSA
jgi:CheY-like chemotaxis protein